MLRLVLLLVLVAPVAGAAAMGPYVAVIDYRNGHHEGCAVELCFYTLDGEGGDAQLDARQEFTWIGVHLDVSIVDQIAKFDLLPDAAIRFDLADVSVDQPVFRILAEDVGPVGGRGALSEFVVAFHPDGATVHATRSIAARAPYPDRLSYDTVGPFDTLVEPTSSDAAVTTSLQDACAAGATAECDSTTAKADDARRDATPEVLVGLDINTADVGTGARSLRHLTPMQFRERPVVAGVGARGTSGPSSLALPSSLPSIPLLPLPETPSVLDRALPPSGPQIPEGQPPIRTSGSETPLLKNDPKLRVIAAASAFVIAAILAALYSRINGRADALRSERRAHIMALLTERGPTPVAEIARILAVDRTTVEHHVRLLRRTSQVVVRRHARQTLVALPGQDLPEESPFAGSQAAELIVAILGAHGGALPRNELHRLAADLPLRTRNHTLKQLAQLGVIVRESFEGGERVVLARAKVE